MRCPRLADLAGGVAQFLVGNLEFRVALGIAPLRFRAAAALAASATVPLGMRTPVALFLGLTPVLVAMLLRDARAASRGGGPVRGPCVHAPGRGRGRMADSAP